MTKRTNTSITPTAIELFAGVGGFRVGLNEVTFENGAVRERERESKIRLGKSMGALNENSICV